MKRNAITLPYHVDSVELRLFPSKRIVIVTIVLFIGAPALGVLTPKEVSNIGWEAHQFLLCLTSARISVHLDNMVTLPDVALATTSSPENSSVRHVDYEALLLLACFDDHFDVLAGKAAQGLHDCRRLLEEVDKGDFARVRVPSRRDLDGDRVDSRSDRLQLAEDVDGVGHAVQVARL